MVILPGRKKLESVPGFDVYPSSRHPNDRVLPTPKPSYHATSFPKSKMIPRFVDIVPSSEASFGRLYRLRSVGHT